jgi:hypothetical protein
MRSPENKKARQGPRWWDEVERKSGRRELQALAGQKKFLLSSRCHNQIPFLALVVLSKHFEFSHIPARLSMP